MNKLQKTLIAYMDAYEGNDEAFMEVLESHSRIIDFAETIKVVLYEEEAELISKAGLEWVSNFTEGEAEWDSYRDDALKLLD